MTYERVAIIQQLIQPTTKSADDLSLRFLLFLSLN
jgi:hypothetical protein